MTRYKCLVLDHDDTVVQSEQTTGYPCLLMTLERFRPGATITLAEYARDCYELGFAEMCRRRWSFTQQELDEEFGNGWTTWKPIFRRSFPAFRS